MMTILNTQISIEIILALSLSIILVQMLYLLKFQKLINSHEKKLQSLKNDIQALLLCSRGVGEKIHLQQKAFRYIQDRQDRIEYTEPGNHSYQQAIALLNRGATTDEMVDACDLSQGEVELIALIEKMKQKYSSQDLAA